MKVVELIIDEKDEMSGIQAISVVESPAIMEGFVMLSKEQTLLKSVDKKRSVLVGSALIPNKKILRRDKEGNDYEIFFSEETVRKASEGFLIKGNQSEATLEHKEELKGMTVVESWIIEGKNDKSKDLGMDLPQGTWMVSMKVTPEIYAKAEAGEITGFSIEGMFADKLEAKMSEEKERQAIIEELKQLLQLKTYNDYPESAKNNAKKVLEWRDKYGDEVKGMTRVGWTRANQLAKGENISRSTIARMASFKRHEKNAEVSAENKSTPWRDKGRVAWLGWGGSSGVNWAISKLESIDSKKLYKHGEKCAEGYVRKDGKCVKKKDYLAEIGKRGGVKKSPKAPKSGTPNKNPKGKGTAKGDASGKRGAKVSAEQKATLQKKANEFNEKYKEKLGYGANIGALSSVFQRGLGAFNTSHSPNVKSPSQWAFARVNAFLYLLKNGRPQNAKYTTDYDLLPTGHPKSKK